MATVLANNMGPLLNVYLLSLKLDKLAFVGTRSAVFTVINVLKLILRGSTGDLSGDMLVYAGGLGVVAIAGVFLANVLLLFVSQKVYERVTWVVISVSGVRLAFL
jgi:hypothetical protein